MKRALKVLGLLLVAVPLLGALGGWAWLRAAWPKTSGELTVRGLHGEVTVRRDALGVPHLFAQQEADVFFAQGFVHAQDRLWQMYLGRALGRGELAKLVGPPGLDADRATRTLGLVPAAKQSLEALSPDARVAVEAYAAGVNAFLATKPTLPAEFAILGLTPTPWEPLDTMLVAQSIQLSMSLNAYYEVMRVRLAEKLGPERAAQLIPPYPADGPTTLSANGPGVTAGASAADPALGALSGQPGGSNAWVVHGSRTTTGKPLLANDTHLGLPLPSIWYENGLHAGRYEVEGFSFPGAPFVAVGHDASVAWGVTNMCSDVQDLYLEKLDRDDAPTTAEFDGHPEPLQVREERIEVKGGEPVVLAVRSTRHGPLVNQAIYGAKKLPPVAMRWAAHEQPSTLFNALEAMDRARDWKQLREALRSWDSPSLNFVFADVDGTIGYQGTGRLPVRAAGHDGAAPTQGWLGQSEWQGFLPFEDLPFAINPPAGFLVSANNKVAPEGYPHHLTVDWGDPYRARRITEVLASNAHVSPADMRALQADDFSQTAQALRPFLAKVTASTPLEKEALAQLEGWDLHFTPASTAASVYFAWYTTLLEEVVTDEVGDELMESYRNVALTHTPLFVRLMTAGESRWFDDVRTTDHVESRDELATRAFQKAVAHLAQVAGPDPRQWRWGRLHTMTFAHQPFGNAGLKPLEWLFNAHTVEAGGEPYAVNATFHAVGTSYAVGSGPSQRFVADLADWGASQAATAVGQSGLTLHPHREDQVDAWAAVRLHPMPFARDAIFAAPGDTLTLHPDGETK